MTIRVRNQKGNVLYGLSGVFKLNSTASAKKNAVLHLASAKADAYTVEATMTLTSDTIRLDAGEFVFETQDGLLRIENRDEEVFLVSTGNNRGIAMDPVAMGINSLTVNFVNAPS